MNLFTQDQQISPQIMEKILGYSMEPLTGWIDNVNSISYDPKENTVLGIEQAWIQARKRTRDAIHKGNKGVVFTDELIEGFSRLSISILRLTGIQGEVYRDLDIEHIIALDIIVGYRDKNGEVLPRELQELRREEVPVLICPNYSDNSDYSYEADADSYVRQAWIYTSVVTPV